MRPSIVKQAKMGGMIGFFSGIASAVAMCGWMFVTERLAPNEHQGSTAIMGPVMCGCEGSILGLFIGGGLGALLGLIGYEIRGWGTSVLFGILLTVAPGVVNFVLEYSDECGRFSRVPTLFTGWFLICPLVGGTIGGAFTEMLRKENETSRPDRLNAPPDPDGHHTV
jgi:hypothetical protein